MNVLGWILLGGLVAIILWLIYVFNSLITLKNRVQEAWSDIEVQLKRRYDLIPNLVETVKGYAKHEKAIFDEAVKARERALTAGSLADRAKAENALTGALKSILALSENYPDLKASQNFLSLQQELTDTEDKISAARRFYNGNVRDFNIKIQVFPNNLIAGMFGFSQKELFELEEPKAKEPVKVKF